MVCLYRGFQRFAQWSSSTRTGTPRAAVSSSAQKKLSVDASDCRM